jgi:site-specific DNA recombinase
MAATGATAREYLRVSYDRSGRQRSPDEQHNDHERDADRHGWTLLTPYSDIGSASRYARKARDEFDKLLADLANGKFGADILMLWESSRGSRKESEWLHLVELCEEHQVQIFIHTHSRVYDCSNARDRRSLLEDAIDAAYESSKVSERVLRTVTAEAAVGRPHGHCPFGYVRRYDERTGRLVSQDPHPEQAPIVQELFDRLLRRHSLYRIAADFRERGIVNGAGNPFTEQHLRVIARRHAYAGMRVHDAGRNNGNTTLSENAKIVDATWQPLVDKATFFGVQDILNDPSRRTSRAGSGRHLMSMIARCDVCSGPMAASLRNTVPKLLCHKAGHVKVVMEDVDSYATDLVIEYLSSRAYEALSQPDDDAELRTVRDKLAEVESELKALSAAVKAGKLSVSFAMGTEPGLLERQQVLKTREADLVTPSALAGMITPGGDVRARWKTSEMSTKRELCRILFTPPLLGEFRVCRSPQPGVRVAVEERVVFARDRSRPVNAGDGKS